MNLRLLIVGALVAATPIFAQTDDGGVAGDIKVTSTVHPDRSRTDLQTDFSNNSSEARNYDAAGKLTSRVVYQLNEQGQPVSGSTYNPKGTLVMTATYERDSAGHVTEETDSTPGGKLIRKIVYHYDTTGQLTGADATDAEGRPIKSSAGSGKKSGKKRTQSNQ